MSGTGLFWQAMDITVREVVFGGFPGQAVGLAIGCIMMERRKSLKPLVIYLLLKTYLYVLLDSYMTLLFPGAEWKAPVMTMVSCWLSIVTCAMFGWAFQGGVLKAVIGMSLAEVLATVFLLPSIILVNKLEGKTVLTEIKGQFQLLDLLVYVLVFLFFALVYPLTVTFLKRFRKLEFKNKKFWWILIGGYFFISQTQPFLQWRDNKMFVITMYMTHLLSAMGIILGIYLVYRRNQRKIQQENEFLRMQMHLMESHYRATQQQIRRMESGRKLVEQQMEELRAMMEVTAPGPEEKTLAGAGHLATEVSERLAVGTHSPVIHQRITSYLQELHREYDQLQAGMYCNDWMVDAVLYCQIETARRRGISVDCSLQGYDRGNILEEDLVQMLYQLLEWGIRQCGKRAAFSENRSDKRWESAGTQKSRSSHLRLHVAAVKNQLVMEFAGIGVKKKGVLLKNLKRWIEKYHGSLNWRKNGNGMELSIILERQ